MDIKPLSTTRFDNSYSANSPKLSKPQLNSQFVPFASNDSRTFSEALKAYALTKLNKEILGHRLVEVIDHPAFGKVQHFEIFDPANDISQARQHVYIVENHEMPLVSIATNIGTGAKNENNNNNGISHFLEHLIFKGCYDKDGKMDKSVKKELSRLGARINAHTSFDNTSFDAIVPKENFAEALKLHVNMVNNPAIPQDELDKERKVVIEEINRSEDDIFGKAINRMVGNLNAEDGTVRNVLGPRKNIMKLSRQDILNYHKKYYRPENRQMIVMGDVSTDEALKAIKKSILNCKDNAGINKSESIQDYLHNVDYKDQSGMKNNIVSKDTTEADASYPADTAYSLMGTQGPKADNIKESAALTLISFIINKSMLAELNKQLPEGQQAIKAGVKFAQFKDFSHLISYAIGKPENIKDVQSAMTRVIQNYMQNGISQQELDKAKAQDELVTLGLSEHPPQTIAALSKILSIGSFKEATDFYNTTRTLTPADLNQALLKYFSPQSLNTINILPNNNQQMAQIPAVSQQQSVQKSANAPSFTGKLARQDKISLLNNGTELLVRQRPNSPLTSVSFVIKGGYKADFKPAQTKMLELMLKNSGTMLRNFDSLNNELEMNGVSFDVKTDAEGLVVTATCPARNKDQLINLVSEIVSNPGFMTNNPAALQNMEQEFNKQREMLKNSVKLSQNQPANIAVDQLVSNIYPAGHSYGLTESRILQSIDNLNLNDIREAYTRLFSPSNINISAVGNLDAEQTRAQLSQNLAGLKDHPVVLKPNPDSSIKQEKFIATPKEDIKQAEIFKAWKGPGLQEQDAVAMKVLLTLLGGSGDSRLFNEFRDNREGLCYSVSAEHIANAEDGHIQLAVGTSPDKMKTCLDLFTREINKIKAKKVSDDELDKAKALTKTNLMLTNTKSDNISQKLATHRAYNIPSIEENLQKIDKVTAEDLLKVAKKYFSGPAITSVVAPEKELRKFGYLK